MLGRIACALGLHRRPTAAQAEQGWGCYRTGCRVRLAGYDSRREGG